MVFSVLGVNCVKVEKPVQSVNSRTQQNDLVKNKPKFTFCAVLSNPWVFADAHVAKFVVGRNAETFVLARRSNKLQK